MSDLVAMRNECWEQAVHSFGTSYVFQKRAAIFRRRLQILTFLGIVFPALIGTSVATYGAENWISKLLIGFASAAGLLQIVLSIWSLVAKWDDSFAYSTESQSANMRLFEKYRQLGQNPPSEAETKTQINLIKVEATARAPLDERQDITENEQRMGMRAALRQLGKTCAACNDVPTSMKPSNCDVCGNFKVQRI